MQDTGIFTRVARARRACIAPAALAATAVLSGVGGTATAARPITPVAEILRDLSRYYGRTVRIETGVSRHIDHRVWEMANGKLLVIRDEPVNPAPREGERMRLTGAVYPLEKPTIEGKVGVNIEDHFFTDDFLADDVAFVVDRLLRISWPIPVPDWFWPWARWYLHRGEFADDAFRSRATRPRTAPFRIPDWGWSRLRAIVG